MKMMAKMFGVLCAASLMFCTACDNLPGNSGDGDDGDKGKDTVTYEVGKIVDFNGKNYLVTKNTEAVDVSRAMVNTDNGQYYLNENASIFRDTLLASYGVVNYIELFDIAEDKTTNSSNQACLYDTFIILCSGKGSYKIRQRWISKNLFPTLDAEAQNKSFEAMENNVLRERYEPNLFIISNTMFETDVAKRFQDEYGFNYDDTMRIDFSDTAMLDYILKRTGYVSINGTTKSMYAIRDKRQKNAFFYELENYNVSRFFEFGVYPDYYLLTTQGDGELEGSTSGYKLMLTVKSVKGDSSGKVQIEGNAEVEIKDPIDKEVEAGYKDELVDVSSEMIAVPGVAFKVPATVTFSAPFEDVLLKYGESSGDEGSGLESGDSNPTAGGNGWTESTGNAAVSLLGETEAVAPLNEYTKVTFVPVAENGGVTYVPKEHKKYTYDFIARFAEDYQTLFKKESAPQPGVTLRPDEDVVSDKTTPRFTFSGSSLRIELENMMTSEFDIKADSNASNGKAGILVNENSRAEAIITFPAGNYKGYAVIRAPSPDNDAFYINFGDDYVRVYADDPPPAGYASTSCTPLTLSCTSDVTVRMTILKDDPNRPNKPGETGMYIDYVEFTKD